MGAYAVPVAIVLAAASTATTAYATHQQAESRKKQLDLEASAREKAAEYRNKQRERQLASILSAQRAGFSASGVTPGIGSALALSASTQARSAEEMREDQDLTAREVASIGYERDITSFQQSLIPFSASLSFARQLTSIYLDERSLSPPVSDPGGPQSRMFGQRRRGGG